MGSIARARSCTSPCRGRAQLLTEAEVDRDEPLVHAGGYSLARALRLRFGSALSAAIQLQSYIQATILQPQLDVISQQKSLLVWGTAATPNLLNIRGENDQLPPGGLKTPTFVIKNNTPINAQDVRIKLSAPKYDGTALTSAPSFQNGRRFIWTITSSSWSRPTPRPDRTRLGFLRRTKSRSSRDPRKPSFRSMSGILPPCTSSRRWRCWRV